MALQIGSESSYGARDSFRDLLASLSLANLCFLNVWIELGNTSHDYYRKVPPGASMISATIAAVVFIAVVIWGCIALVRQTTVKWVRPVGHLLVVITLLLALNVIKTSVTISHNHLPELSNWAAAGILAIFAAVILVFASWRPQRLIQIMVGGLLVLFPLFPILAGQAIWTHVTKRPHAAFADRTSQASRATGRSRVIWMLFDEWDHQLAFSARPKGLSLPALDRLSGQAFSATRAVGGGYGTANAVPSMLIGKRVVESQTAGPAELMLELDSHASSAGHADEFVRWSAQPSLFSRLRSAGWTTSVVGWYHPYCRVLGRQVDWCTWEPGASIYDRPEYAKQLSFFEAAGTIFDRQLSKVPLLNRFNLVRRDLNKRDLQVSEYTHIRDAARAGIGSADFVYVHWPVPHPYGIFDRRAGTTGVYARATYLDNLALVDRIVGEFYSMLDARGEWENTTLILSSDHSLRVGEWNTGRLWSTEEAQATRNTRSPYVPFLIKLAGQVQPLTYDQPFSILLTHDLILALARGELRTPVALSAWLDSNRGRFPLRVGR